MSVSEDDDTILPNSDVENPIWHTKHEVTTQLPSLRRDLLEF